MAKISDFSLRNLGQEIIDFKDEVSLILNNGKYQSIVVGTSPGWTGRNGEFCFFNSSGTTRTYFYNNNKWNFLQYDTSGTTNLVPISNNLVTVSNSLATTSGVTLINVSNNLVTVSNNLSTASTTILNVSNNLVTASNNISNLITQVTNGALKGWVTFNGQVNSLSILDSYNVGSVTRAALGTYEVSWSTVFLNTAYCVSGAARRIPDEGANEDYTFINSNLLAGTAVIVIAAAGVRKDSPLICVMATGDQ